VTTLSYGSNLITFDNLRSKLIHYEQCLKFLKSKDALPVQHQAFATATEPGTSTCNNNRRQGGKGKGRHNNNRKGNTNLGGDNRTSNSVQQHSVSRSMPTGTAFGNIVFAWSSIQCSCPSCTNIVFASNNSSEGVLGSRRNTVCQICFTPGHSAVGCPQCYTPS